MTTHFQREPPGLVVDTPRNFGSPHAPRETGIAGFFIEKVYHMQGTYGGTGAEMKRSWFIVDASGKPLGRVASEIARVLRGKHRPTFTPHVDTGDFVIVVNADKVAFTGNKLRDK